MVSSKDGLVKGRDFIGVSVVYFCHNGKGNFAMHKRSQNTRDEQGIWDVGGGALEFNETVEECLKKEVREEWGAEVLSYEFLGFRDVHRFASPEPGEGGGKNNQLTHWIALDFKVLVDPAQVKIGEPHKFDEMGWFTPNSLPAPLHSQLPYAFQKYKDQLK